jgi:16S rRNA processing protein RimM
MTQPSSQPEEYTTLGRIGAAVGIKGWVRLVSFTDPADNILQHRHFILAPANGGTGKAPGDVEKIEIDESRIQGKGFIGHICGCDDREQARQYTGRELLVAKTTLPDLDEDDFYWFQLEGLQVINLQDENLGTVHHLMETGANDVLVVKPTGQSLDDQERLIPWIREQVIKRVDLEDGIVRVDWERDY